MGLTAKQAHRQAVLSRDRECQGPGPHRGRLQAHHIIPVQRLHIAGLSDEVVADPRNGVALCEFCHEHAHWGATLPAHLLPVVQSFADDYGFFHTDRGWLKENG